MRVSFLSLGSRGDVQPFVTLGTGLRRRGHEVSIASAETARSLVERSGLRFESVTGGMGGEAFEEPRVIDAVRRSASPLRAARAMSERARDEAVAQMLAAVEAAGGRGDLVITSPTVDPVLAGGPRPRWCATSWTPATPTSAFPVWRAAELPLGRWYNRLSYVVARQTEWRMFRPAVNRYRAAQGRRALGRLSPLYRVSAERPCLYPFSPHVVPPPADWPRHCHVTGYWFPDRTVTPPGEGLRAFVADGPAPVVATFGSTWPVHPGRRTVGLLVGAARRAGRPLVLVGGPRDELPDGVFRVEEADYDWLFPRACAVVHHAGYGTAAAVLRAGVPQVTVPTVADNPFWARRMAAIGVSPRPLPFTALTAEALSGALAAAVHDPRFRDRAARTAELVRAERGVETACDVLEEWWARHGDLR
ncbi:glycosyltransferase [Streptomyces sp. NPDC001262]|uniref:glycosyltransferase n=1 Tax=Streptomyces sp. NPDC001262 TaxID=3364552 RepID=UPI0036ABE300